MPINNGVASFNNGRDCQIVLQGPRGRIDMPNVMSFDSKQSVTKIEKTRLDGQPLNAMLPRAWTGSFELERGNSALDDEIVLSELAWRASGIVTNYTLYQFVAEVGGGTSTYQYDGVMIEIDAGQWKGDATVPQHITFTANTRTKK